MLSLDKVTKSYGPTKVLNNISIEIPEKETIALLGGNGSGKSTILKLFCGLLIPDSGNIIKKVHEHEISYVSTSERSFFHRLSIYDNLDFFLSFHFVDKKNRSELINLKLMEFGLESKSNQEYCTLSSGEKKKLSIIRAIAKNPKILLLDEYTTSLDYKTRWEAKEMLLNLKKNNPELTIIFSTHYFEEIVDFASSMLVFNRSGDLNFFKMPKGFELSDINRIVEDEF